MQRLVAGYRWLETFWLAGVDPRVYALLRISFAAVAMVNLIDLWPQRQEFFSRWGLIDLSTTRANVGDDPYYSVFFFATEEGAVTAVFVAAAAALCFLGAGVFQRAAAIAVFAFHLSYTYRAFPIVHGWDGILRIIAFIVMISPTSDVWSVRPLWKKAADAVPPLVSRHGLVLLQVQLAVIYWQTLWLKLNDPHWRNGEFISYFQLSMYSRVPVEWWAHAELLSSLLTFGTLLVEFLVPILLFFRRTRWLGIAVGASFHLGILVLSTVWIFSLTILIPYVAFLDGQDLETARTAWGRLRRRLRR